MVLLPSTVNIAIHGRSGKREPKPSFDLRFVIAMSDLALQAEVFPARFDYTTLDTIVANEARSAVGRIKDRARASIVDTGNDLIVVKEMLGHGRFGLWLTAEF